MQGADRPVDAELRVAKALAHPLRARLLRALVERVASPSDLARELGEPVSRVSYHVRTLLSHECVELVRTEPRRGAVEHYYRATVRPELDDRQWGTLPAGVRVVLLGQTFADVWDDVSAASRSGAFAKPDVHVSRTPLELDEDGWRELSDRLAELLDHAAQLQAAAIAATDGRSLRRSELVIFHFDRSDEPVRTTGREADASAAGAPGPAAPR